ncbi:hypothetical protein GCM10010233_26670 [Streptomyces pseudogriseolus]|uniref:Glycoside hydrolase family 3 C-terminal domain-containing protein n=1 Tax=Streptomyces pseudogriseolus TaxID=36817 RepID=A0ABQ2TBM4_STREZ|nr:hypothetical protein GCM10010233_26670 [Streptomyces gancidicus]GGS58552.1 hypothetical protein GCM10010285_42450 [Streptomyces rubiginosus]
MPDAGPSSPPHAPHHVRISRAGFRPLGTGVPVAHLAVRNPYDIAHLDGVRASLASYCWTEVELRAAARVIAGRVDPRGTLPVPVQRADDPAEVLFPAGYELSYGR